MSRLTITLKQEARQASWNASWNALVARGLADKLSYHEWFGPVFRGNILLDFQKNYLRVSVYEDNLLPVDYFYPHSDIARIKYEENAE